MPTLDVSAFQSAFGRLCDLSAQALSEGAARADVLLAFQGRRSAEPEPVGRVAPLGAIRAHRGHVNHRIELVKHYAAKNGIGDRTVAREMIKAGRMVREVCESEWCVELPIVSPSP